MEGGENPLKIEDFIFDELVLDRSDSSEHSTEVKSAHGDQVDS